MKVVNLATVSVPTTAGGTEIFSSAQATAAVAEGLMSIVVNPSTDIAIVDAGGLLITSAIPGAVVGTAANSPFVCPAGIPTEIAHRSGPVRAIAVSATSTVKVGAAEGP